MCASEFTLDEGLSHQHMGAVYHRGKSPSASTSESHEGGCDNVNDQELLELHFGEQYNDKKSCGFNCLDDILVLKQVVERGDKATTSPEGLSYPKVIASARKEVDSEEHHSAAEADLLIVKEGTQMQDNG
ncbi:hypothetical protein BHE74_00038912 [Ensete ventricosum]|nr:hypothetical protein BHE74_00038912 [Ensete ventricosum]RZS17443.1 hypothetical protein BHM03_00049582 [Ensete ventricosum]